MRRTSVWPMSLQQGTAEDHLARELLVSKYKDSEDNLEQWGRTSLPVVIEFRAAVS